jgi:hypothetical protein
MARTTWIEKITWKKIYKSYIYIYGFFWLITYGISCYYSFKKDLFNEIQWWLLSMTFIICLFYGMILERIKNSKEEIINRIENANQYERHVIKELHNELLKKQ